MKNKKLKIGVIGSGAVGCIIATKLSTMAYDVEYVYDRISDIVIGGMQEMSVINGENSFSALVKCVPNDESFSSKKDIIILACKSTHMERHCKTLKENLAEEGFVVMLNNLLVRSEVTKFIDKSKIVGMFIEWSCVRKDNDEAEIIKSGPTMFGVYTPDAKPLAEFTCKLLEPVSHALLIENFNEVVLGRIVLNASISVLGALSGLRIGDFLSLKYGKKLFVELVKEGYFAYYHIGIVPVDYDNKLDYSLFCEDSFRARRYQKSIISFLKKYNGKTTSSILHDIQNCKSVEIDYSLGKIIETGAKNNIDCKFSKKVYKKISEIVANNDTIRPELLEIVYREVKGK